MEKSWSKVLVVIWETSGFSVLSELKNKEASNKAHTIIWVKLEDRTKLLGASKFYYGPQIH